MCFRGREGAWEVVYLKHPTKRELFWQQGTACRTSNHPEVKGYQHAACKCCGKKNSKILHLASWGPASSRVTR